MGSVIINQVRVGRNSIVAAGATVIRDVADSCTVAGVPAKDIKKG